MKRILAGVSLVALASTAALADSPPKASHGHVVRVVHVAHVAHVAPADEYFGKLKLSVLGIRNTIKDVAANIDVDPARWDGLRNKAIYAEDAIRDWEHKYPEDTWLAKTVFALERMYAKIDSDEGRRKSLVTMNWLVHDFPQTWYGKQGRREIAEGHVGHPPTNVTTTNVTQNPVPGYGNPNTTSNVPNSAGIEATPVPNPMASLAPNPVSSLAPH